MITQNQESGEEHSSQSAERATSAPVYSIYVLTDPREEFQTDSFEFAGVRGVRYVGQTWGPIMKRFNQHLGEQEDTHKRRWIKKLQDLGLQPGIARVSVHQTEEEVNAEEIRLIAAARTQLGKKLINKTMGGEGARYTAAQLEENQTRANSGTDPYLRPGNMPVTILRDVVPPDVRSAMM